MEKKIKKKDQIIKKILFFDGPLNTNNSIYNIK